MKVERLILKQFKEVVATEQQLYKNKVENQADIGPARKA